MQLWGLPLNESAVPANSKDIGLVHPNILIRFCSGVTLAAEFDLIGPWSEVKLEILRGYAGPYSKI